MDPTPTPQGVHSTTFHPAPFEHSLSIPSLYDYHAEHSPSHPVFAYSDAQTGASSVVTYLQASQTFHAIAEQVSERVQNAQSRGRVTTGDAKQPPVIAVLSISDSLSYVYLLLSILSLGLTAFPMSPRNSAPVTAHLLKEANVSLVYVSADKGMQALAQNVVSLLAAEGIQVDIVPMITPENWSILKKSESSVQLKSVDISDNTIAIILHSSGTTAFPKLIRITKRGLINWSNIPCFGELDLAGKRIAAHTNPMFHAMGLASVIWPVSCGAIFVFYKPIYPPVIPTPANFLESWVADRCDIVFCVPVFIDIWSQDEANILKLQALDSIVFSGASVNKNIGDRLAKAGIVMHPFWGSTEVGPATMFVPRDAPPPDEWDYFKLSHHAQFKMIPHENLDNIFEPVMIPTKYCFPQFYNTTIDGSPAYSVGDFLERHPTDPERFRMFGRIDDQIVLSTGENINPVLTGNGPFAALEIANGLIEAALVQDKRIAAAIMFGNNKVQPGVLIEPAAGYHSKDSKQAEEFKELIWETIERVNSQVSAYARIEKNMIVITSPEKPLDYTPKMTPRRRICLKIYLEEIERLYQVKELLNANRAFPDRR